MNLYRPSRMLRRGLHPRWSRAYMLSAYTGSPPGARPKQPEQAVSLELRWRGNPKPLQQRGSYIQQADSGLDARRRQPAACRTTENQGHSQGALINKVAVSLLPVLSQAFAMIGREDDKSIPQEPPRRERVFEVSQSLVDISDLSVV